MRGRFCTQPFLVEGGTCRLNDFLLLLRWANRSPPSSDSASPAHLWFMVASPGPDRTVPGLFDPPRGRLWGWESPSCMRNHLPQPAQPVGGPLRA